MAGAELEPKLWPKSEPETKINNFGSATLLFDDNFLFKPILYCNYELVIEFRPGSGTSQVWTIRICNNDLLVPVRPKIKKGTYLLLKWIRIKKQLGR